MRITRYAVVGALVAAVLGAPTPASAAVGLSPAASQSLRGAVEATDLKPYLQAIEDISLHHGPPGTTAADGHPADGHGDYRLAGTAGDEETTAYIADQLRVAGLAPVVTHFPFDFYQELAPAHFEQTAPTARAFSEPADFATMSYSGSGNVTGPVVPTNDVMIPPGATANSSTSGCEVADFPTPPTANAVALIQRGTCTFRQKAKNAAAAGYVAAVIFNEGQVGRTDTVNGTLGGTGITIPVLGASFAVGEQLYADVQQAGGATVHVTTNTVSEVRESHNVVADTPTGRTDRVVLAGAHTDSTVDGPAVNDDGTGMALLLGLAKGFKDQAVKPTNQVRFGFWGAEESGLLGSAYYASQLSPKQVKDIAVNLAFDMLGSDNSARLVYDGDGSATGVKGPKGSGAVEDVFTGYYAALGLPTDPTALDGRTDYASFSDLGIPVGGITSGAEEPKTPAQQQRYGGVAGQPYYVCYHEACDTVATIFGAAGSAFEPPPLAPGLSGFMNAGLGAASLTDQSGAAAHAVLTFAQTTSSVNGTDRASDRATSNASQEYRGSRLRK